jgi:hypothetical protein
MAFALTQGSTVNCFHQGKVALAASQSKLTVGAQAVLVETDIAGKAISGCGLATTPASVTCAAVVSEIPGGTSLRLKVGGKAVLINSANGLTNGSQSGVPATWSVLDAGQTKLKTS